MSWSVGDVAHESTAAGSLPLQRSRLRYFLIRSIWPGSPELPELASVKIPRGSAHVSPRVPA